MGLGIFSNIRKVFTYFYRNAILLNMMSIMKNTTKSLFFYLFALSFSWVNANPQPLPDSPKAIGNNGTATIKPLVPVSTGVMKSGMQFSNLSGVDFSKLWMDVSKKLGNKPLVLLTIEGETLPKLLQKSIQIADKVVPDCSSLMSLAITGFAGGTACPGVDEKAGCYAILFFYAGNVEPVFLFKAQSDCVLVKNLEENKTPTVVLKAISNGTDKSCCWQLYGRDTLIKALDKDLQQVFPFINQEKNPDSGLKVILDVKLWNDIFQKMDNKEVAFLKFLWDTFVASDVKRLEIGFDVVDKTLETKMLIFPQEYSALASFFKSSEAKIKDVKFLNWSSQELIQELAFHDYSGSKHYINSLSDRIKFSQDTDDLCVLFKDIWAIFYPLLDKILTFCDENLVGNTQGYADLQNSGNLISSKGFGFFQGKQLKRETVLTFIEDFSSKLKSSINEAIDKKFPGWEVCKSITLGVKRSVDKHCDCDIDQVFWKGEGNEAHCPIWFVVHKNYLLYADDINNLKRLIDRMEEMKEPSYLAMEANCYSRMKMGLFSALPTLGIPQPKSISELSAEITCSLATQTNTQENAFVNTIKIPGFLDLFSLKTILPSSDENVKKEDVKQMNPSTTVPKVK